ncbi:MAG: hypothetical protein ABI607_07740 [Betaproteobacteria bacterium]
MRELFAALLATAIAMLSSNSAVAQTNYFQGVTPRPADVYDFPSSLTVTRSAPPGGPVTVVPTLYTHLTTDPNSQTFEWANLTILNNRAEFGENVANYAQANKNGRGPTWAGVFELQGNNPEGGWWGLEIDAMANGPSTMYTAGTPRVGMGVVVGRAGGVGPPATVDYGVWLLPFYRDRGQVDVNFGFMSSVHCRVACFGMNAGEKIAFDAGGQITQHFDPQTGFLTFATNGKPILEIQMETGEIRVLGRTAKFADPN